jgi:flagellar basal-body rod protein FlgG
MSSSLFHTLAISRQDLLSRVKDLDVTSNNLANVNTAGYKYTRANFQEVLNRQIKEGTQLVNTQMLTAQGTLSASTNPLDWAIQGEGFFSVTLPDGTKGYTRDGQLVLDANRKLVTSSGYPLVWDGTIAEGMTQISLAADGKVTALDAAGASVAVGTVQLTRFANPSGLTSHGDNLWLATDLSGAAQTGAAGTGNFGTLHAFQVEQSNVDLAQEMTHLMTLQRSFSMSLKAFEQTDLMISQAINLRKA